MPENETTTDAAAAPGVDQSEQTTKPADSGDVVEVALRRDCQVGDVWAKQGSVIAVVQLAPGVSLNFLVDAVRTERAGKRKADAEAPKPAPRKRSGKRS